MISSFRLAVRRLPRPWRECNIVFSLASYLLRLWWAGRLFLRKKKMSAKKSYAGEEEMSVREAQVYDRQIRLWGLEAQKRMKNAKLLICGFRALSAEVCKNLVLAGISVVIQDSNPVTVEDLGAHICLGDKNIGQNVQ